nr:hypothetical protein [Tanacetum cinerariifolium]
DVLQRSMKLSYKMLVAYNFVSSSLGAKYLCEFGLVCSKPPTE